LVLFSHDFVLEDRVADFWYLFRALSQSRLFDSCVQVGINNIQRDALAKVVYQGFNRPQLTKYPMGISETGTDSTWRRVKGVSSMIVKQQLQ
jgi:hypothetical protein